VDLPVLVDKSDPRVILDHVQTGRLVFLVSGRLNSALNLILVLLDLLVDRHVLDLLGPFVRLVNLGRVSDQTSLWST
jgi:hypothetical protein